MTDGMLWDTPESAAESTTPPVQAPARERTAEPGEPAVVPADAACCGQKYPMWAGRTPLPHGCQLCPDSPTYWRRT